MRRGRATVGVFVAAFVQLAAACGSGDSSGGGGAAICTGDPGQPTCDFSACGGDVVGTWKLNTYCAPSCVTSVYDSVTYSADGKYNGSGTWKVDGNILTTTVSSASSSAEFCVEGDVLWTRRTTNCGPGQGSELDIVRQRDCGADAGP